MKEFYRNPFWVYTGGGIWLYLRRCSVGAVCISSFDDRGRSCDGFVQVTYTPLDLSPGEYFSHSWGQDGDTFETFEDVDGKTMFNVRHAAKHCSKVLPDGVKLSGSTFFYPERGV